MLAGKDAQIESVMRELQGYYNLAGCDACSCFMVLFNILFNWIVYFSAMNHLYIGRPSRAAAIKTKWSTCAIHGANTRTHRPPWSITITSIAATSHSAALFAIVTLFLWHNSLFALSMAIAMNRLWNYGEKCNAVNI